MENLTEAQRHIHSILDEELAVIEHPSCSIKDMRARVVHLAGRLDPYLGRHISMSQDADLSAVDTTSVKEFIRYARSAGTFDAFLHFASRAIGCLMTPEERIKFFGKDAE